MAEGLEAIANDIAEEAGGESQKQAASSGLFGLDNKNLVLLAVAAVTIVFVLFQFFFKPKFNVLYSGLTQSDAAAISSYLEKNKVKYKIEGDGSNIVVSGASIPKLRLELANKGIPKGSGVGFEIFDKTNINISDFNQKINYRRALEGELARTISSLNSVKSAKVHLVLPKKSIFKEEDINAKASVIITTEFGADLSEEQIKGIQHLVSSGVQGLKSGSVQITDQGGTSLVSFTDEESISHDKAVSNEKKRREFERKLEADLLNMLSPILGKGNVLVNITTEMNFDESEVNIELFNPITKDGTIARPVVRSEKVSEEKYRNDKARTFGTVGTQNNMPSFVTKSNAGGRSSDPNKDYVREDRTKNYEVSRQVERIIKAAGLISKISVAVVVNKDLNASERSTLRQTVQVAAGLNMERGDQVIVTGIKFSSTPYQNIKEQEEQKEYKALGRQAKMKKYVSLIVVVAVGFVILMIIMVSLTANIDSTRAREIDELLKEEDIPLLHTIDEKIQEAEEAYHRQLSLEGNRSVASMKNGLSNMAMQDPKTIARGLQAYIND